MKPEQKHPFSGPELAELTKKSDLMGFWMLFSTWGLIAFWLALAAWGASQGPWVGAACIVLSVVMLGGRQLCLAIATHEAAHRTLFKTRWLNMAFSDWLAARPIGLDVEKYRTHHLLHHQFTGTDEDVDRSLVAGLPTTKKALVRKFVRDLTFQTGIKFLIGRVMMDAGLMKWTVAPEVTHLPRQSAGRHLALLVKNISPFIVTNALLALALAATGHAWLYLLWATAYLTTYTLFIRIRALAEHAGTEMVADTLRNTRTTHAGWLAKSMIAPLNVNYHQEHHMVAAVPWFNLPKAHALLRQKGLVGQPPTYPEVLHTLSKA